MENAIDYRLQNQQIIANHVILSYLLRRARLRPRGGRPRLIIHEYAVTLSGRGFGRVEEVAETQVLEARLACESRL